MNMTVEQFAACGYALMLELLSQAQMQGNGDKARSIKAFLDLAPQNVQRSGSIFYADTLKLIAETT